MIEVYQCFSTNLLNYYALKRPSLALCLKMHSTYLMSFKMLYKPIGSFGLSFSWKPHRNDDGTFVALVDHTQSSRFSASHILVVNCQLQAINWSFVIFSFRYLTRKFRFWRKQGLSGPKPIPILGNSLASLFRPMPLVEIEWFNKYGRLYGWVITCGFPNLHW